MTESRIQFKRRPWWIWTLALLVLLSASYGGSIYIQRLSIPNKESHLDRLADPTFLPLPLGAIQPRGWLLDQLKLQSAGLTGHLDEFWPDVEDSGWIGGKAEGWERAPYWLDGVVPMAFLTHDAKMTAKVKRWINYILDHQSQDGWFGPNQGNSATGSHAPPNIYRDPWPQFIMLKVLCQYAEATGDPRVIPAMEKNVRNIDLQLNQRPLFAWNYFRWGDFVLSLYWLYDHTHEPWVLNVAVKAANQGYDWTHHFWDLPLKHKSPAWNWIGHVVNNAMGLKVPALMYRLTGDGRYKNLSYRALEQLDKYHGEPNGLFSGDECLAGLNPSQGTELCAIVEMMFSLESDLSITGDVRYADRLEKVAYNTLPAACTADYWQHQYVEQSNQVASAYFTQPIYATVSGGGNLFGLEPHYGCCTANMHQGWPKLASHLWMASMDGGLVAAVYAPSVVETQVGGIPVRVEEVTDYPFSDTITFNVMAQRNATFPIYFRVPEWAQGATLRLAADKEIKLTPGTFYPLTKQWAGKETIVLKLPMAFEVHRGFQNSISLQRGPLVYSLGIEPKWSNFEPFPYQTHDKKRYDLAAMPTSRWNYALKLNDPQDVSALVLDQRPLKGDPFDLDHTPLSVKVQGRLLENWQAYNGAAAPPPPSPVESTAPMETLKLVPYGATRLRVTAFPVLK